MKSTVVAQCLIILTAIICASTPKYNFLIREEFIKGRLQLKQ